MNSLFLNSQESSQESDAPEDQNILHNSDVPNVVPVPARTIASSELLPPGYTATFTAGTSQVSHLADVFSAITALGSQALMIIKPSGIILYSEYNHISNVQLNVDPSLFSQYNFTIRDENDVEIPSQSEGEIPSELRLGVDIALISDAFTSVASSVTTSKQKQGNNQGHGAPESVNCYFTYNGEGNPLVIEFEDNLMSEKIEFLTFYTEFTYPYDSLDDPDQEEHLIINHNEIQSELILKSDVFSNLLGDLSQINTIDLYIYVSNELKTLGGKSKKAKATSKIKFTDTQLNFISRGPIGHSKLIYPSERTILEKLVLYGKDPRSDIMEPINTSFISCYNFTNFIKIFRAVKLSSKCKILKDLNGVLSIQLLCKNINLPNYAGTLITFHMLEVSTFTDEDFPTNQVANANTLNNIFDDESYEYVNDYNKKNALLEEYQDLDQESRENPTLSYASFRNPSNTESSKDIQISDTPYIPEEERQTKRKKRRGDNNGQVDDDGTGIKTVGGAVEVPLFL